MRANLFLKQKSGTPDSHFVVPGLEALEDRFLLSGGPLGPTVTATITSSNFSPQKELVLPDGKILLGMTIYNDGQSLPLEYNSPVSISQVYGSTYFGIGAIELVRLNADGTLDTTFGNGGICVIHPHLSDVFSGFALAPDGSIIVAGIEVSSGASYLVPTGVNWPGAAGFSLPQMGLGRPQDPLAGKPEYDLVLQDSGISLFRVSADGSQESSLQAENVAGFHLDVMGAFDQIGGVAVQSDGKIVVAGEEEGFGNSTVFVARYNTDGNFDTDFNPGGGQPGVATTSLTNPPVVAGPNYLFSGFSTGYGWVSSVAVEGDGKVVVGGSESGYGVVVLEYNADGSADASFGSDGMVNYAAGTGSLVYLSNVAIQPDGKIIAAGTSSGLTASDDPTGGLLLVRFNTDGSFDSTFGQGGVVQFNPPGPNTVYRPALPLEAEPLGPVQSNYVWSGTAGVIVQADGKIVVAGEAEADQQADFVMQGLVARFNADGSPDSTFGPGGVQFTTLVATDTTYLSVDPLTITTAPDGSARVIGLLNYGSYIPFPEPGEPAYLVLLDYQDGGAGGMTNGTAGRTVKPSIGTLPFSPTSASDAAFRLLALHGADPNAGPVGLPGFNDLGTLPIPSLQTTILLPVPTDSQSSAVARLSGGGKDANATDDAFALSGEPDAPWNLVQAADPDARG